MVKTLLLTLTLTLLPAARAVPLTLRAGQTASLNGTNITLLRFNDSRCPLKAICVMAGNVRASVFVVKGKSARLYTVYLPGVPVVTAAGEVRLRAATRSENGGAQRLTFEVGR